MREVQADSLAASERFASLTEDAVAALEEVELVRLQNGWTDVGGDLPRSEYVYVFRNKGERAHHVVPLNAMERGLQFNMKVRDKDGKNLIYLDSSFCAAVAQEYATRKLRAIRGILEKYRETADFNFGLTEAEVRAALAAPSADRRQDAGPAIENALREVVALYSALPEDHLKVARTRQGLYDGLRPEAQEFVHDVAELEALLSGLLAFLEAHQNTYVPFVLLTEGLEPARKEGPRTIAMIKHSVQAADPGGALLPLAYTLAFFPLVLAERALQVLGLHLDRVTLELNPRASSTHFPLVLSQGMYHLGTVCKNLPLAFARDNQGQRWAKSAGGMYYFHRQKAQVSQYQSLGISSLRMLLLSRESWSAMVLLYVALAAAFLWGGAARDDPQAGPALVGLAITAFIAYVAFSHGKPKFQDTVWVKALAILCLLFRGEVHARVGGPLAWASAHPALVLGWFAVAFAVAWAWAARERTLYPAVIRVLEKRAEVTSA